MFAINQSIKLHELDILYMWITHYNVTRTYDILR